MRKKGAYKYGGVSNDAKSQQLKKQRRRQEQRAPAGGKRENEDFLISLFSCGRTPNYVMHTSHSPWSFRVDDGEP